MGRCFTLISGLVLGNGKGWGVANSCKWDVVEAVVEGGDLGVCNIWWVSYFHFLEVIFDHPICLLGSSRHVERT